jgi:DNA polymerase III alpha subunit (gram-positive type)
MNDMKKIKNKGLNEYGVEMMNKLFEQNRIEFGGFVFKVGQKIGKSSKTLVRTKQLDENPDSMTMGFYHTHSCTEGPVLIPLKWLNYEIIEYIEK